MYCTVHHYFGWLPHFYSAHKTYKIRQSLVLYLEISYLSSLFLLPLGGKWKYVGAVVRRNYRKKKKKQLGLYHLNTNTV